MLNQSDIKKYTIIEKKEIPEINAVGYLLSHNTTKARVLLVENDDENKVFSIAFRTPPSDDTGVAHILEHSVLCGSEKFPSKDPFVELAKGSMNTFLNAMTYPDKTVYPIASCNDKDYHNLMHVYLDAVFFPNIYRNPEILKQEGWHYELDGPDAELKFNGVVYNEMKGVFSSPEAVLERRIQGSLLKDTPYAFESGGDPDAIPQLTRENFLAFHTRYYHPSNSYIYLYGNADFVKELEFIDEEYLSRFEYRQPDSEIALQSPYDCAVKLEDTYSVSEETDNGVYLSYNVQYGNSLDNEQTLALQLLDYVLFTMPGAPVKKELVAAGIGSDVDSIYDNGIRQPVFSVIMKNASKGKEEYFVSKLEEILRDQVKKGINKKALRSAINSFEFRYRESSFGSYSKGLIYGLNFLNSWLYDDRKPFEYADSLTPLARLSEKIDTGYFEKLVEIVFLNNPHKSYVNLYPEVGKNEKMEKNLTRQLNKIKNGLDKKQLYFLEEDYKRLKKFQEEPSSPEDIAAIPMLELTDIPRDIKPFSNRECTIGDVATVVHEYHTNGIVYFDFCFDLTELPEELIPYATLLVEFYRYVDTEHFTYHDLASEINLKIGTMTFQTGINTLAWKQDGYRPFFSVNIKCLENQVEDAISLLSEVLFTSKMDHKQRLKEIISEVRTKMDVKIPSSGHLFASGRALSYIDPAMKYKEVAEGLEYYWMIRDLDDSFDQKADEMIRQLKRAQNCIFRKENLTLSLTGEFDFKNLLDESIRDFSSLLWNGACVKSVPVLKLEKKNEGFKSSSKVQYVAVAGKFETQKYPYTGALRVLRTIFSYDYLWVNVRVSGGAYGCMASFRNDGYAAFVSYRDPKLKETLDVYRKAADYVRNFQVEKRDMKKYIIGTISAMDQPLEPAALGARSFAAYKSGITEEMIQKERLQVLEATQDTIRDLAPYIETMMEEPAICAIGNDKKIEENEECFKEVRLLSPGQKK